MSAMRGGEGGADAVSASCAVVRIKSVLLPAILMEKPFSAAKTAAWTIHSDSNRSRSAFCERSACRFKTRISINEEMTKPLSRAHHQLHCELPYGYIPCECFSIQRGQRVFFSGKRGKTVAIGAWLWYNICGIRRLIASYALNESSNRKDSFS